MTRHVVALALVLLAATATATAAPADRAAAQRALAALEQRGPVKVLWPAHADLPRHVSGPLAAARDGAPESVARAFLAGSGALFGVRDAARELRLHAAVPTAAGTVVRFQQEHQGLPVYGAHLTVLVDPAGHVVLATSSLRAARPALPTSVVDAAAARGAVAARGALPGRARLVALPVGDDLRAAWVVWGRTMRPFGIWDYLVDASTGAVVGKRTRLWHAKGRVYTLSPAQGTPAIFDAELLHLLAADQLKGDYADSFRGTIQGWSVTAERSAVPTAGDYLYDPQEPSFTDSFAEVQMYYHVTRMHQWLKDTLGFQRTTRGTDQFITTYVNLAEDNGSGGLMQFDNAFFGDIDGDGLGDLGFGQGSVDYAYDADVVYHELAHSVIDEGPRLDGMDFDELGLNLDPGSLNEGLADYFSSTFAGDPMMGEYVGQSMGGVIRQLVDPSGELLRCRDVPLMGEFHDDGMPLGRGLWDVRTALGATKADAAIWAAVQTLPPDASFSDLAAALLAVVQQQHGSADAATVRSLLEARDLVECPRLFELADGDQRMGYVFGQQTIGNLQIPHALQYFVVVPANATRLIISASGYGASGGNVRLIPLARRNEPVLLSMSGYDVSYQADVTGAANRDLVLTPGTPDKLLVPGGTYYFLITNDGEDDMVFDVRIGLSVDPLPPTDAGVPDATPPRTDGAAGDAHAGDGGSGGDGGDDPTPTRGCSCRAGDAATAPAALLALLALAGARGRRRR